MGIQKIQQIPLRATAVMETEKNIFTMSWSGWFRKLADTLNGNLAAGFTGTIVTAPLTVGGTEGSMTFTNGILTSQVAAT